MKFLQLTGITIISGFLGIMLAQLILPAFVSTLSTTLQSLGVVDAVNIISWAAILMTLIGLIFTIIILGAKYYPKPLFLALGLSFALTVILLSAGSFVYLYVENPIVFENTTILLRIGKFYTMPTLVSLTLADPQPIWIISTILFILIFNLCIYYLMEEKR
jgi:hypothetical protein